MKQEVIQDFLNLPGIAGVALMDRRSRPYFCGIDQALNFQQKEALAQGILQVFETIPDEFESFKFHFSGYQVHIYKLDHGIILLVLTQENLVYTDYLKTIKNLKVALREDITNAIATFRLIAGTVTLPGISITRRTVTATQRTATTNAARGGNSQAGGVTQTKSTPSPPVPLSPSAAPAPSVASSPSISPSISLDDAIAALNHLSKFTTQYLGTHVIANYWKSTRPQPDRMNQLQIDRAAQFSLVNATPQQLQTPLTPEQQTWIQEWVATFIKRCAQVIRDFPSLIQQTALSDAQKRLLLG
jgi:hypothetical protein